MKTFKNIIIAAGLATALLMTGCNNLDLTTPTQSSFDESVVFSNYTLAEYNIYSIYEVFGHTNCHRGRYLAWYGFNNDVEMYVSTTNDEKASIARYSLTPTNGQLNLTNGPFNELQTGIERANLCINGLKTYGNIDKNKEMGLLYGEALVARALLYTELLKAYGEVPARFEPVSPESIYLPKTDRDVIFTQLLSDLEESWGYMTFGQEKTTTRPGLSFSKGLYARLVLMACGYGLRPDEGKVNTGDAGTVRLSETFQKSKNDLYTKALAALEDVIQHGGHSLYQDYEQLWKDFNNFDTATGKEVIYSLPMSDLRGRWNYSIAVRCEADNGAANPWTSTTSNRGGEVGPVPTLYWRYDEGDQRRDVSCANYKFVGKNAQVAGAANWYFGKYRFDWMEKVPYTGGNDDGCKPVYMRYPDILLMAAEIANELGQTDKAKGYVKEIVDRAYRGNAALTNNYMAKLSDKTSIFNAIVDQRGLEFVGEYLRKNDLIRWNLLKTKIDETVQEMNDLSNHTGKFADIGSVIYYKTGSPDYTLSLYGYGHGQTTNPGEGWTPYTDSAGEIPEYYFTLKTEKINSFYDLDPDTRQWWPIPQATIETSQGALKNDYGY